MKKIGIMIGIGILVIGGGLGALAYFNLWPFQGSKIAGVPNGALVKKEENAMTELDILLAASGKVSFNMEGKSAFVYLDVYEKENRVSHKKVAGISSDRKSAMNGELVWGVVGLNLMKPEEVRAKFLVNSAQSEGAVPLKSVLTNQSEQSSAASEPFENGKIKLGKRYILQYWNRSENGVSVSEDFFNKKELAKKEQTIILYLIFK
ncbi:hypothetical protein [Listeria fleischmannii]|uniref:Uncharacterized protein n=2 Tax=Listeria fleischmannii TaxID=1069827 RepID=W7DV18_9LIST|nr:hypothetical protein [Listeria fleischmannii]EUJ59880.1 hypothetical protein MCOL2_05468 [Listeria fleischmannii FSL S10-1203]